MVPGFISLLGIKVTVRHQSITTTNFGTKTGMKKKIKQYTLCCTFDRTKANETQQ
jgi:hypothetical protein